MHQRLGAGPARGLRDMLGAFVLHRLEALLAGGKQDAHQIDDGVGPVCCCEQRLREAYIGLHGIDLPDPAQRLQMAGELRPAHGDAHTRAGLGDGADHVAADEA